MAAPSATIDHTDRLPSELLSKIFAGLSQPELLIAAGVLRGWRDATRKPNDYRSVTFSFPERDQPLSDLHVVFPSVLRLTIDSLEHDIPLDETDFGLFDGLESLVLEDGVDISIPSPVLRAFQNITFLEFNDKDAILRGQLPQFLGYPGPVELELGAHSRTDDDDEAPLSSRETQLCDTLLFRERGFTRRVDSDVSPARTLQVLQLISCAHRLTAVEIDDRYLALLTDKLGTLPALCTLGIVVISWAIVGGEHLCKCAAAGECVSRRVAPLKGQELFPALHTFSLRAALPGSTVLNALVLSLSRALEPHVQERLHLELTHGLQMEGDPSVDAEIRASYETVSSHRSLKASALRADLQERARELRASMRRQASDFQALRHMAGSFHLFSACFTIVRTRSSLGIRAVFASDPPARVKAWPEFLSPIHSCPPSPLNAAAMHPTAAQLPGDVLRAVFELLAQPDVLATAAVSRAWRASAVLDASYYRACNYFFPRGDADYWNDHPRRAHDTDIEHLRQIIGDAEEHHYRLSLTLRAKVPDSSFPDGDWYDDLVGLLDASAAPGADILPVVRRAIPLTVHLNLYAEWKLGAAFLSALTAPAPHLRSLTITIFLGKEPELPANLFSGTSPLLTQVTLTGTAPMRLTYRCFANVRTLALPLYHALVHVEAVVASFPAVLNLRFGSESFDFAPTPAGPLAPDVLAKFRNLQSLEINDGIGLPDIVPALLPLIPRLPAIRFRCFADCGQLAVLLASPPPRSLEIHDYVTEERRFINGSRLPEWPRLRMSLATAATWRCLDVGFADEQVLRTLELSGAAATLTAISIDDRLVRDLARACPALPVLEKLDVVLTDRRERDTLFDQTEDVCTAQCPRLATLVLHGTHHGAMVGAEFLTALVRALRSPSPKLVLKNGLALEPGAEAAVAFSSVRRSELGFYPSVHVERVAKLSAADTRMSRRDGSAPQY
ncbi:hypothetical protein AURDEDRAFT_123474 [Auricularia subglabra TFB-10046 SS5]|nr:hypothetical protein AURDEDRAFT_123474 [Auricularia subglabra TFB-10046 SS5]